MRTQEERKMLLHKRARELKREADRRRLAVMTAVSSCLFVLLVVVTFVPGTIGTGSFGSEYAGSSLLFESAGGYVLTAVIAFAAGVVLTVIIRKYMANKRNHGQNELSEL